MYKQLKARIAGKKGFTLIELIVVIAILVVLMAIMVPMMSKYIESASKATELANARAVYSAAAVWAADRLAGGGAISNGATLTATELSDYFSNPGTATYKAIVNSDGSVVRAQYGKQWYPDAPPSP